MNTPFSLNRTPFSTRNSYLAISELPENHRRLGNRPGLYLRTVRRSARTSLVAKMTLTGPNGDAPYAAALSGAALTLTTDAGAVELCFADESTLLLRGSAGTGLELDFLTDSGAYDYLYALPHEGRALTMANCYKNNCQFLLWTQRGEATVDQQWEESSALYSRLRVGGPDGFLLVCKEIQTEWDRRLARYDFDAAREATDRDFADFLRRTPTLPQRYEGLRRAAAYLNWSSLVRADGFLTRDAMYMSKNWMTSVWSWDHCFNALALAYGDPEQAWNQFMLPFDFQDASGRLPDSVSDVEIVWNYCKPPIHGWALARLLERATLSPERLTDAYEALARWTDWWETYRRRDGLFFYNHGNDSGWDNATAFSLLPPVATPDLQADLVVQMDTLADLATRLNRADDAAAWRARADGAMRVFLARCFRDGLPVAIQLDTGRVVENESLLPYQILILGDRLPRPIRDAVVEALRGFYTRYGFATERPQSSAYRADGYWRGPIWAPSTLLLLDGLARCGERALAREAAERFVDMTTREGFAENFDALTGEGLRDRAYTWTASAALVLAKEYLA